MREAGVHNPYEFYGEQPHIGFRINRGSRDVIPSAWQVIKRGHKLSDAWYDYGCKSFSYGGRWDKKEQLETAKAWASQRFGIKEWARDPFRCFGDAAFIRERIKELSRRASQKGDREK